MMVCNSVTEVRPLERFFHVVRNKTYQMLDPYRYIRHTFNEFKQKMPSLNITEQKLISILRIIIVFFIILLIYDCIQYVLKPYDGYDVQPFETMGIGENSDGKALATLLKFDLQNIKEIYETGPDIITIPKNGTKSQIIARPLKNLSMPQSLEKEKLDYSISQIGTLGAEGVSLSIGNVLLLMKESFGKWPSTITCSLQKYNSTMVLVAILKDNQNNKTMTFKEEYIRRTDEQIPSMINDLAFKISLALCKQSNKVYLYPKNWQTFEYVTQGRDAYNSYISTRNTSDLDSGYKMALLAKKFEPGYFGTFELLSDLGFCYYNQNYTAIAKNIFLNIYQFKPFESELGLGYVYYRQRNYTEALKAFDEASKLNPKNPLAWNGKGIILHKMGNNIDAVNAFKNAIVFEPTYGDAWYNKGNALAALGKNNSSKYEEAIQAYSYAIKQDPSNTDAWYEEGNALAALGKNNSSKYEEAMKAYNKSIDLNSSNSDAKAMFSKIKKKWFFAISYG